MDLDEQTTADCPAVRLSGSFPIFHAVLTTSDVSEKHRSLAAVALGLPMSPKGRRC